MAHFARLNKESVKVEGLGNVHEVIHVHVVDNTELLANEKEEEVVGIAFLEKLHKHEGVFYKKTSYNAVKTRFRKNYAGIGGYYCPERDAFISKKTYPSWILNEETCQWQPPIEYPTNGNIYFWNEEKIKWEEFKDEK